MTISGSDLLCTRTPSFADRQRVSVQGKLSMMVFNRNNKVRCRPRPAAALFLIIISCRLTTSDIQKRAFRGISTSPVVVLALSNTPSYLEMQTTSPSWHSTDNGSTPSNMPTAYDWNMLSSAGPSISIMDAVPTLLPTNAPDYAETSTNAPTISSPSSFLTSVPTMRCHDKPTYKSPINAFTCEDHRGTNCTHWHYLGLNTTQLARLIEDCPVTCRVPCGSFLQFSVALGFTLVAVPGLMDATTKQELEVVTWQYLLAYSRAKLDRQVALEFDDVELLSQAILHEVPTKQKGNLQLSLSLALRMQFQGFTIGVSSDDVSKLLQAGISSDSYQVVLKEVDEFFSEGVIFPSLEQGAAVLETGEKDKRSSVPPIMIVLLVAGLATLLGISLCMNPTRSDRLLSKIDILPRLEIHEHLHFTSPPRHCETQTPFPISNQGSPLSLDDSRASTFHAGNGLPSTSQCLTVNASSLSSDQAGSTQKIHSDQIIGSVVVSSQSGDMCSAEHEEDEEMEHPLSKVIPPMIIFDDIDDNLGGPSDPPIDTEPPQVPAIFIKASSDLILALCRGKGKADPSILYAASQEWENSPNMESLWRYSENNRSSSPFGLEMDSDSDNDDEMPDQHHSRVDAAMFALHRRSSCSVVLEDLQSPVLDIVPVLPCNLSLDLNPMEISSTPSEKGASNVSSPVNDEGQRTEESAATQDRDLPKRIMPSSASDEQSKNTPAQLSTPGQIHARLRISHSAGCTKHKRRWTFSPLSRIHHDSFLKPGNGSKIPDLGSPWKLQRTPVFSERPSLEAESLGNSHDLPTLHEFDAPRNGQLGLIIESDAFEGLVVYSVKDYSPLLGLVQKGDKIVQVDGKNTSLCSLTDMSRLLSTKQGILHGSHSQGSLKIVVLRPPSNGRHTTTSQSGVATPSQTHNRTSTGSYWSSKSSTTCSTSMPNLGITLSSSSDETDTSHVIGLRPIRSVRFRDELMQGRTLFHHKVRGSF